MDKKVIPKKFYNVKEPDFPVIAKTIGELKEVIKNLPDDLIINQEYTDYSGTVIVVYNINENDPHLQFHNTEDYIDE